MTADSLDDYMRKLSGRVDLLIDSDVEALCKAIEAGQIAAGRLESCELPPRATREELQQIVEIGDAALERFILANMRLALKLAKPHMRRLPASNWLDLVQAASAGLITAVQRYDYRRGFKFSTYATWWIRSAIDSELLAQRDVTVSQRASLELRQIAQFEAEWHGIMGEPPSVPDIARELELAESRVRLARSASASVLRLNRPIGGETETELGELIPEADPVDLDAIFIERDRRRTVQSAMSRLDLQERDVIRKRFGFDGPLRSIREVAYERGESYRKIREIESVALNKLREATAHPDVVELL